MVLEFGSRMHAATSCDMRGTIGRMGTHFFAVMATLGLPCLGFLVEYPHMVGGIAASLSFFGVGFLDKDYIRILFACLKAHHAVIHGP